MFQKMTKHRANEASNDVHRLPLGVLMAFLTFGRSETTTMYDGHVNCQLVKYIKLFDKVKWSFWADMNQNSMAPCFAIFCQAVLGL